MTERGLGLAHLALEQARRACDVVFQEKTMTQQEKDEATKLGKRNGHLDKQAGRRLEASYGPGAWGENSYPYWYSIGYRQGWDSTSGR